MNYFVNLAPQRALDSSRGLTWKGSLALLVIGGVLFLASPASWAAKPTAASEQAKSGTGFTVIDSKVGVVFKHENGATAEKYMAETMSGGGLFFDFNNDYAPDILLVSSGWVEKEKGSATYGLFQNLGDGTFYDVSKKSGLKSSSYGMGACSGDYDNDGYPDLYLTSFSENALFHNNGDGTFSEVFSDSGLRADMWSTSCAFADIDNDGDLDLYVANYVDATVANNKYCGDHINRIRAYCHPNVYNGVSDQLFRNDGGGKFTESAQTAGIGADRGKGLGVVFGDFDKDRKIDIYVSNDSVPNFLYQNLGENRFSEVGLLAGVAVNGAGNSEAGMGTDFGDLDGDGLLDLVVTNLDMETNTFYRNLGEGLFEDVTFQSQLGEPSLRYVGFGTVMFDYDNDGDLDLGVANGHILDNATRFRDNITYAQRNMLFDNDGSGEFELISPRSGDGFDLVKVSRTMVVADIENDGDLDMLITNNGQTADLLRNDVGQKQHSITLRTLGTKSNRDGVGAWVSVKAGGREMLQQVKAGSSYLGQNDLRLHFGLGTSEKIEELSVRWPSGIVDTLQKPKVDFFMIVKEGSGLEKAIPFVGKASALRESTKRR